MTIEDRNDAMLIRYRDAEADDGTIIKTFYATCPSEILKIVYLAKEYGLCIEISGVDENDPYYDREGFVYDIKIGTGGGENIPYIDIWLQDLCVSP